MGKLPCGHEDRREKYGEKRCRSCYDKEYARTHPKRRADNAERVKRFKANVKKRPNLGFKVEKRNFKLRGGLTIEEYDSLLAKQGGVCAICGRPPGTRRFPVDHDHKTGAIRGLLCFTCNYGLGWFRDDPVRLEKAASYLKKGVSPTDSCVQ